MTNPPKTVRKQLGGVRGREELSPPTRKKRRIFCECHWWTKKKKTTLTRKLEHAKVLGGVTFLFEWWWLQSHDGLDKEVFFCVCLSASNIFSRKDNFIKHFINSKKKSGSYFFLHFFVGEGKQECVHVFLVSFSFFSVCKPAG